MACEFKSEDQFKKLAKQVGSEELATYTYFAYNNAYPQMYTNTELRKMLKMPYKEFSDKTWRVKKAVRRYNAINGTAHHFKESRIGQSTQVALELVVNYLPVNLERQRQRDLARSERDKSWYSFQERDFNTLTEKDIKQYAKLKYLVENDIVEEPEVQEEVFGLDESLPELEVHTLGNGQYEAGGEIFGTYQDALASIDTDPYNFAEIYGPEFVSLDKIDLELQGDLENMYPTVKLLDYLYEQGTQRMKKNKFRKEASSLMSMMKAENYSNAGIIEAIKCL